IPDILTCSLSDIDDCCDPEDLGLEWGTEDTQLSLHRIVCATPLWVSNTHTIPECPGGIPPETECRYLVRVICLTCHLRARIGECRCEDDPCFLVQYSTSGGSIWVDGIVTSASCDPLMIEAELGGYHGNTVLATITE